MERLSNSPNVTQHVSDGAGIQGQVRLIPKLVLLASMLYCLSEHLHISDTGLGAKQRYNSEQEIALMASNLTV